MNVIDALVLQVGLDASAFEKGQRQIDTGMKKTRDESTRTAKQMQADAAKTAESFRRVRNEILALIGLVVGYNGLKSFVGDITKADSATGYLAASLGMATKELTAWQGVAERSGGTADGIAGSINHLQQELEQFKLTGQGGEQFIPWLNMMHISLRDMQTGKLKTVTELFGDLADRFHGMDPARRNFIGGALGLDQGTINTLSQGRAALGKLLAEQNSMGLPSEADAKRAQEWINTLKDFEQEFRSLGRTVLGDVTPMLLPMLKAFDHWAQANREIIAQDISKEIEKFADWLKSIDWDKFEGDVESFAAEVNNVVTGLGGWVHLSEGLFALWAGGKFAAMLGNARLFAAVLSAIGVDQALTLVDPSDRIGSWIDRNVPFAAAIDNFFGQLGIGRTYDEQQRADPNAVRSPAEVQAHTADAMAYFIGQGWTPAQAAGIVGNMQQESSFNPQAGAGTAHQGLMQWNDARRAAIEAHFGKPLMAMSYQEQLAATQWELTQGPYRWAGDLLRGKQTTRQAAAVIEQELAPGNDALEIVRRAYNAESVLRGYQIAPNVVPAIPRMPMAYHTYGPRSDSTAINTGPITINAKGSDAKAIAAGLKGAMDDLRFSAQVDRGLA